MYRAVPAGSVYYLRLVSGDAQLLFETLHNTNNSTIRANEGFGLTLLGLSLI